MQLGEKKLIVQRASVGAKTNMNNVSSMWHFASQGGLGERRGGGGGSQGHPLSSSIHVRVYM